MLIYQYVGDGIAETPTGVSIDDIDQNDALRAHARYAIALSKNWDVGIEAQYDHIFESEVKNRGQKNASTSLFAGNLSEEPLSMEHSVLLNKIHLWFVPA